MTTSIATVDVESGGERTLMRRVAVIGDVGGYVRHLRHALGQLGADVVLEERDGEHGGAFWYDEFPEMVSWAFGG